MILCKNTAFGKGIYIKLKSKKKQTNKQAKQKLSTVYGRFCGKLILDPN